jgi:hypothetical protein
MRAVIRDLAGADLNAWTLSPQRFMTLAGAGRAAKTPDTDGNIV